MMQVSLEFGGLLGRSWVDFVAKLGGKLDPSWYQNLENWGPKTMSKKMIEKQDRDKSRQIATNPPAGP